MGDAYIAGARARDIALCMSLGRFGSHSIDQSKAKLAWVFLKYQESKSNKWQPRFQVVLMLLDFTTELSLSRRACVAVNSPEFKLEQTRHGGKAPDSHQELGGGGAAVERIV